MTVELSMLLWSAVLMQALIVVYAAGNTQAMGLAWGIGNRDEASTAGTWVQRTGRAYRNLWENLIIFAVVVLVAHLSGVSNSMTVLGAQIFFVARVVHAFTYVLGISALGIRTAAYGAGFVGTIMIFLQLL